METDYTEAMTPICISLTNLAQRQLHAKDEEDSTSKSRHGGQPPCASRRDWAGGPPHASDRSPFPRSSLEPREPGLAKEAALAEIRGG